MIVLCPGQVVVCCARPNLHPVEYQWRRIGIGNIIDAYNEIVVCCRIFITSNRVTAKQCCDDGTDPESMVIEEGASVVVAATVVVVVVVSARG